MSLKSLFDNSGSPMAVPPSPPGEGFTPESVSIIGNSKLHNQYSNIGDPNIQLPAYTNFGASAIAYSTPQTSQFGLSSDTYQLNNKYKDNPPAGAFF
jgi:hypothetical protein